MFKDAIKHKKPKIAMLEVYNTETSGGSVFDMSGVHRYFDIMPLSLEKYKDKDTAELIKSE